MGSLSTVYLAIHQLHKQSNSAKGEGLLSEFLIAYRFYVEVLIQTSLTVRMRTDSSDRFVDKVETQRARQLERLLFTGEVFVFAHFGIKLLELAKRSDGAVSLRVKARIRAAI